ncbi:hypothetical protein ACFYUJ_29020 [Streptomyces sp. NPDC004520]|uniref:hypothetical protein n=1 Tax=Streptomyces sp. NPDC004520 TaxID=3364702 RepID=UPI0036865C82
MRDVVTVGVGETHVLTVREPGSRPMPAVGVHKEARLKGLGTGPAHGFGHVYPGGRPGVAGVPTGRPAHDLPGDGRHAMAVARRGPEGRRIVPRALSTGTAA